MLSDFSLALIPPLSSHLGENSRGEPWDGSGVLCSCLSAWLSFTPTGLGCFVGIIRSALRGHWTTGSVFGWEVPGVGLLFLQSFLDWQGVSLSWLRPEPVTHSCSLAPDLWAGPLCSVGQCWVAEWMAEQEAVGSLSGGSTGIWLVLGLLAPRCSFSLPWWSLSSQVSSPMRVFSKFLPSSPQGSFL